MRRISFPVIFAALAVVGLSIACEVSASTANLADAWMSTDAEGASRTTTYPQDSVFYAQADLQNAPEGTAIRGVWTAVSAEDTEPNLVIGEAELQTESTVVTFDLTNDLLWPVGGYKIDLYLNGTLTRTVEFEVR